MLAGSINHSVVVLVRIQRLVTNTTNNGNLILAIALARGVKLERMFWLVRLRIRIAQNRFEIVLFTLANFTDLLETRK